MSGCDPSQAMCVCCTCPFLPANPVTCYRQMLEARGKKARSPSIGTDVALPGGGGAEHLCEPWSEAHFPVLLLQLQLQQSQGCWHCPPTGIFVQVELPPPPSPCPKHARTDHTLVRAHAHTQMRTRAQTHACTHTHIHKRTYTGAHVLAPVHASVYTCVHGVGLHANLVRSHGLHWSQITWLH